MSFVDEAKIYIKAGDGGQGCVSFYRDKYMRNRKPDGGDGGKGGDIIFSADSHVQTLQDFRYKKHYKAPKGGNASSNNKHGKNGQDFVLRVPVGTIIRDQETGLVMKDLALVDQSVVLARGGKGGFGNACKHPTLPQSGEERHITLELKVIADVGIIGFPNAGKSTLISAISRVRSKIASYPFTTKQPILGIVKGGNSDFVIADLPGIIEGAHKGKGLGDRFLKHAERTKVLLHLIDMAGSEGRDPYEDFRTLEHEIQSYGEILAGKERIVVANKMDLPEAAANLTKFKKRYKEKVLAISSLQKEGLDELLDYIRGML